MLEQETTFNMTMQARELATEIICTIIEKSQMSDDWFLKSEVGDELWKNLEKRYRHLVKSILEV